ncbi:ArdC family protein [Devosia sp.]|uniref:ArdC family protein n=1 Tax=Devosia sp. TaxID=1871048 RepID=UPI003A93758E
MTKPQRRDIHSDITNQLIAAIEADPGNQVMPWRRAGGSMLMPRNVLSGRAYNGVNILSLWVAAQGNHFETAIWGTYRQWQDKGCQVRKGQKSSLVVFYKDYSVEPEPDSKDDDGRRFVARASHVFNAGQVDGYTQNEPLPALGPVERIDNADRFVIGTSADVRHGGGSAFFDPAGDYIQMPDEGRFVGTDTMSRSESYYAVLAHELVHWSGGKSRLARDLSGRFKSDAYAAEELVAEIGSAFLCAELGITQDVRPDHAQYITHWLKLLKDDNRAIFTAAARASEAFSFLQSRSC